MRFVAEVRAFRQNCVKNNFLLVEYVEQLSSIGGEIADVRVDLRYNGKYDEACFVVFFPILKLWKIGDYKNDLTSIFKDIRSS